jgi:hypothetical protein
MASPLTIGVTTLLKYLDNLAIVQNIAGLLTNGGVVRLQPNERELETSQGVFDMTKLNSAMTWLGQFPQLKVIMVMQDFATWYLDGNGLPTYQGMQAWGDQLMATYGGSWTGAHISEFEMGNEEFAFVTGSARDPINYYNVVSQAYPYLKGKYPNKKWGMWGYTNYSGKSSGDGDPGTYFGGFFQLGGGAYVDKLQIHYYHSNLSPDVNNSGGSPALLNVINAINNQQANYGLSLPISIGEIGYQGQQYSGCGNYITPALQTQYMELSMTEALSALNVKQYIIYTTGASAGGWQDCHDLEGLATYNNLIPFIANINSIPPPPPPPPPPNNTTGPTGYSDVSQGTPIGGASGGYVFHNERVRQMFVGPGARGRNGRHVKTWKDLLPWN